MICAKCKFNHRTLMWNKCDLTGAECYHEYYEEPCPIIDDNYVFIEDCESMGFTKGQSAIELLKEGAE